MKTVIIDNYDSFTYNLYHLVREAGMEADVLRNDAFRLEDLEAYDKIILSPGPGIPQEAGLLPDVIRTFAGRKPMLGVCLGHQAIGEAPCFLTGEDYIFRGLPRQFPVGRYHSWVVAAEGLPACLEVTATSPDGHIMALRHRDYDLHGIQFHPESVLTPDGRIIVENFLRHAPEKSASSACPQP